MTHLRYSGQVGPREVGLMASIKVNKRSLARVGRAVPSSNSDRTFVSGLLFGLSAASLLLTGGMRGPVAPKEGLASDWRAIGSDIQIALGKRGAR